MIVGIEGIVIIFIESSNVIVPRYGINVSNEKRIAQLLDETIRFPTETSYEIPKADILTTTLYHKLNLLSSF